MRLSEIFEADQVKAKEKKPKKVKPNMGHQSPHPSRKTSWGICYYFRRRPRLS